MIFTIEVFIQCVWLSINAYTSYTAFGSLDVWDGLSRNFAICLAADSTLSVLYIVLAFRSRKSETDDSSFVPFILVIIAKIALLVWMMVVWIYTA